MLLVNNVILKLLSSSSHTKKPDSIHNVQPENNVIRSYHYYYHVPILTHFEVRCSSTSSFALLKCACIINIINISNLNRIYAAHPIPIYIYIQQSHIADPLDSYPSERATPTTRRNLNTIYSQYPAHCLHHPRTTQTDNAFERAA